MKPISKISITGTKGKTTVAQVTAAILGRLGNDVLRVDTTGHYVNDEQRSSLADSRRVWSLVPTVCPGRYLWEFKTDSQLRASERPVAVLECSLGCSASAGLGYREHEVGVFLNVMEDHINSSDRLRNKRDVAEAKSFIFNRLDRAGYAVFNADDRYVIAMLDKLPADGGVTLIPCGLDFAYFDVEKHLADGGLALTVRDHYIVARDKDGEHRICDLAAIPWTFKAAFKPSIYNLLHVTGAVMGQNAGRLPRGFRSIIESTRLDPYSGRLTLLKAANGATILADYAHEKYSLSQVGDLARSLTKGGGKVIGVVRLAYDRSPELIQETGRMIASHYDSFIVYDKIDGYWAKGETRKGRRFQKVEGQVSTILAEAIARKNEHVERLVREDEAIARAAETAEPNDVVVVIVNDNVKRSVDFIRHSFKAEFLK